MKRWKTVLLLSTALFTISFDASARGAADYLQSLQSILDGLYKEMMPSCEDLVDVGKGIAGFAALWSISSKVWKSIINAEAIDFYPMFRPFVLGFCVMFFPLVMDMINGLLQPTVDATEGMVKNSNAAVALLLKKKEEAIKTTDAWQMYVGADDKGDKQKWLRYTNGVSKDEPNVSENLIERIGTSLTFEVAKAQYRIQNSIKEYVSQILQLLYQAAALCINTIRIFQMIILSILGPFVFALAVFDGFQHTLTAWLARYVNVFLWLPVCNIFSTVLGKLQEGMLKLDAAQINEMGKTYWSADDVAYILFLIIGIVGYTTVPTIAGYIVNAGGSSPLVQKITSMLSSTSPGAIASSIGKAGDAQKSYADGKAFGGGSGFAGAAGRIAGGHTHQKNYMDYQLSGNNDKK